MSQEVREGVVVLRGFSKAFGDALVLDDVSLDIRRGEIHALLGGNGSGKSTLIKILSGFHTPEPGALVEVDGVPVSLERHGLADAGFRFVHQNLGLVDALNTIENLGLGVGYPTGVLGRIRWRAARRDAEERLRSLGYEIDARIPVGELSAAQRTAVAVARALHDWRSARVLVLDEPTAAMPVGESTALFDMMDRLRRSGMSVVFVSHHLDEVFAIADRVTVLRDGQRVATIPTADIDKSQLVSLMLGDVEFAELPAKEIRGTGPVRLEVGGLSGAVIQQADLQVRAGEIVGISGLTGSGRDELLQLIFGASRRSGVIRINGQPIDSGDPRASIRNGMALVAADRARQSSIGTLSVKHNLTLTDVSRFSGKFGLLSDRREEQEVLGWIQRLGIRPTSTTAVFATLSGGNQQKVVLAKWLRKNPQVLLLDEPTQGVDIHAKSAIHTLTMEAAQAGCAVIVASSDDAELCQLSDRVLVFRDGKIVVELLDEKITQTEIARHQHTAIATVSL
ncbi:sugar ABC transporter ATP-binding protein [Paenarthrobacter aromaticivorans]|uniref:Sugar ABC transporter ATP-binding protein n=1 Tax=Paenarthrobacter aromaticivorans TaxID=2849150 RepID=A0ABS6I9U9_9MICC|nr:sugar ABC transporter ATP-binding protein [Paenarthrobacter sp. MMS21-TAE1-1]MBU8868501.1 sugar ABC transporter ATP-binding protein [Paenarthrobacter sp. MMS21-TAE1-1]